MSVSNICNRTTRLTVLVGTLLLVTACGARRGPDRAAADDFSVVVENQNYLDVVVFAFRDLSSTRLGSVSGLSSATLRIPGHLVVLGEIRLLVDPIGSPVAYLTDEIMVSPGDVITLRVASVVRMSSWSVR
jgi:hypothetical protein